MNRSEVGPVVSFIIATMGATEDLLQTLHSLDRDWGEHRLQICIQDGGVELEDIFSYQPQNASLVISYQLASDGGIYDGLNRGLERSEGQFVGVLGAGDLICNHGLLRQMLDHMATCKKPKVFAAGVKFYGGRPRGCWLPPADMLSSWQRGILPPHTSTFVHRSMVQEVGAYDLKYSLASDTDFLIKVFKVCCKYESDVCYAYRDQLTAMKRGGLSDALCFKSQYRKLKEDWMIFSGHRLGGKAFLVKRFSKLGQFFG